MSIHKKIAIVMAPFLLVIGWIAADHWQTQRDFRNTQNEMEGLEQCDLRAGPCELEFAQLKLHLQAEDLDNGRVYRLASNYEMDDVMSAVVDAAGNEIALPMQAKDDQYHWLAFYERSALGDGERRFRFAGINDSGRFFGEVKD